MAEDHLRKLEEIYSAALQRDASQRAAFVRQACAGNESMRRELESLLGYDEKLGGFLEKPALEVIARSMANPREQSLVGQTLGPYTVLSLLGQGGMGEVYAARDTRLGRLVALKTLPADVAADPERKRRFLQEARAVSALSHPHIVSLYDVGSDGGTDFLVMEYVRGKTLDALILRKGLDVKQAIQYAIEIADAVATAHAAGVIHRDLKPRNVMVDENGAVKVLDFGLAKLEEPMSPDESEATQTKTGVIVGTAAYMSPEQVRGEELDARTDLFSFGALLYEMATGQRAFSGNTTAVVVHAILTEVPTPLLKVHPKLPPEMDRVVNRLLEKDRDLRYQSAADVCSELKRLKRDIESGRSASVTEVSEHHTVVEKLSLHARWMWVAALAAVMAAALLAFLLTRPLPPPKVLGYSPITNDGQPKYLGFPLVTDGSRVYFTETRAGGLLSLAQVSAAGGETALIPTPSSLPILLDISPKRSELLVASRVGLEPESQLQILPLPAGSPRRLGNLLAHDGAWSPDGEKMVYANGSDLYLAKSDGTESRKLVSLEGIPSWPRWSPDGTILRFTVQDTKRNANALWEVAWDGTRLHPLLPGWNNPPAECCGNWTADRRYFVFQSTRHGRADIWAMREEVGLFQRPSREPLQLTFGHMDSWSPVPSKDGKKLFVIGAVPRQEVLRYDTKSKQFVPYLSGISADGLDFSWDGQWVTYVTFPEGALWRSRVDGSERLQLTFPPLQALLPRWSPDRKQIAFPASSPGRPMKIYLISADGGTPEQATPSEKTEGILGWSPDGKALVFDDTNNYGESFPGVNPQSMALHLLDLRTRQVATLPGSEGLHSPIWSRDGRYIVALSPDELTLMLFDVASQKWTELAKINQGYPNWSRDGRYIYLDTLLRNEWVFCRVRVSDHKFEQLASLKGISRASGNLGGWAGLAPDDSPLVARAAGSREIYALDWEAP